MGTFKGRALHVPFDLGNYTVVITVNLITVSDDAHTGAECTPPKPFLGTGNTDERGVQIIKADLCYDRCHIL